MTTHIALVVDGDRLTGTGIVIDPPGGALDTVALSLSERLVIGLYDALASLTEALDIEAFIQLSDPELDQRLNDLLALAETPGDAPEALQKALLLTSEHIRNALANARARG